MNQLEFFPSETVAQEEEQWRVVPDYPRYEVSNLGRFRNRWTLESYSGSVNWTGYESIRLSREGKIKTLLVHRLVAKAWLDQPPEHHKVVNHKNKNRADNRVENLEWCSYAYNNSKHGRQSK